MNTFNFTRKPPTVEIIEKHFPEAYKVIFDSSYKRGYDEGYPQGIEEGRKSKAVVDKQFMQEIGQVCADYWNEKTQQVRNSEAYRSVMPSSCSSVEDRAKAEWDKNPNIRSEFISFASFLAYQKAVEAGQVRVCGMS